MSFKNKVVIVTGSSSGIGAATAIAFSSVSAHVVLVARNKTKLEEVAKKCKDPLMIIADVSIDEDARKIIKETIKKFGRLDVLVNNAGTAIGTGGIVGGEIMEYYDVVMNINIRAAVHLTSLATPHLIKTKGNVVNISSAAGQMPLLASYLTAYNVSKAVLDHFSQCAALELGQYGVRVNVISPGPVVTDILKTSASDKTWDTLPRLTVLNKLSQPEEISDLVLFLASDKAKSITGSNYVIDNGMLIKCI